MKHLSKRSIAAAVLLLLAGVITFLFLSHPHDRYYLKFQEAEIIGLTEQQVVERFGTPTGIFEGEDAWNYQIGRDPGVVLLFTEGKVVEVSKWKR